MILIKQVILHRLNMELKQPFTTNLASFRNKDFFIIEVVDESGERGFGETASFPTPWYTEETVETNKHVLEAFLIPLVLDVPLDHPDQVAAKFEVVRRNNMAKAALEGAIWDVFAKKQGIPLATALGGTKKAVDVGVSIGIQPSMNELFDTIAYHVEEGYKRVKLKIKPGFDVEMLAAVRRAFPTVPIMADANSAYRLHDLPRLKELDAFNLQMIEQPLGHDDFIDHATLQSQLDTPICLDESIHTFSDVRTALTLGSCSIINMKVARVGGITEAKKIHDYCKSNDVPVWCGGMLEAGIGRAHSIALATLPQFRLPGDTSASNRYFDKDIIEPKVTLENGQVVIPDRPGIGYEIDWRALENYRIEKSVIGKS
ncbi:o-succinylbenzoate synthase [Aquibacillus salsiterrae]|uniref:o-succinylbenzoate synthase n=1 Tax=Aquibacillus salsiterrae TaxID=2950439 RepID=A0A9X3WG35_9BACI|nr:o-succinylbenzoate synthase [Aquibacillus salsiterrae]MDC3416809.1 o-succinylbenzoate synthase [Aquibacillus salsiterrae]